MSPLSMSIFLPRSIECLVFIYALRVNAGYNLQPYPVVNFSLLSCLALRPLTSLLFFHNI